MTNARPALGKRIPKVIATNVQIFHGHVKPSRLVIETNPISGTFTPIPGALKRLHNRQSNSVPLKKIADCFLFRIKIKERSRESERNGKEVNRG